MRVAAVLAHGFAGAVRSTRLATVLLELHPTQLGRRGVAWGTYFAVWVLAYCTVSHHHLAQRYPQQPVPRCYLCYEVVRKMFDGISGLERGRRIGDRCP